MWGIGEFPGPGGRKEIAIVHKSWISGNKCFWPPFWKNPKELEKAVRRGIPADPTTWLVDEAHIVGGRYFKSYDEVRCKLTTAVDGSELSSDETMERLRRQKVTVCENDSLSDGSETNEVPRKSSQMPRVPPHKKQKRVSSIPSIPLPPPAPSQPVINEENRPILVLAEDLFKEPLASPVSSVSKCSTPRTMIDPNAGSPVSYHQNLRGGEFPGSQDVFERPYYATGTGAVGITSCQCLPEMQEAIKSIQANQELMKYKQDTMLDYLRTLTQGKQVREDINRKQLSSDSLSIPITTVEEFEKVDAEVKTNPSMKSAVIDLLSRRGGNNSNQIVHRIIQYLMTDELMVEFTFKGATGKRGFIQTNFMGCVYDAVRCQPKGSVLKDSEIEKAVEYWLKKASTRINKKNVKARGQLKSPNANSTETLESD